DATSAEARSATSEENGLPVGRQVEREALGEAIVANDRVLPIRVDRKTRAPPPHVCHRAPHQSKPRRRQVDDVERDAFTSVLPIVRLEILSARRPQAERE